MLAALKGQTAAVACLLEKEAETEHKNRVRPFVSDSRCCRLCTWSDFYAAFDGQMSHQDGSTALLLAAHNGHVGPVECLLQAGADMEARNNVRD